MMNVHVKKNTVISLYLWASHLGVRTADYIHFTTPFYIRDFCPYGYLQGVLKPVP